MPTEPTEITQPQQVMGPGPSHERRNVTRSGRRPQYDGDERKFEIWDLKFCSYIRICGLTLENEPDATTNSEIFDELVQCLDDEKSTKNE